MNSLFGILVMFTVVICQHVTMAQNQADKAGADCTRKFPITSTEKEDLRNGNFGKSSDTVKCYVDCFYKEMNFVEQGGAINEPNVIAFYTTLIPKSSPDTIKSALHKCIASMTGNTECEKTFNGHKCIFTTLSNHQ